MVILHVFLETLDLLKDGMRWGLMRCFERRWASYSQCTRVRAKYPATWAYNHQDMWCGPVIVCLEQTRGSILCRKVGKRNKTCTIIKWEMPALTMPYSEDHSTKQLRSTETAVSFRAIHHSQFQSFMALLVFYQSLPIQNSKSLMGHDMLKLWLL